MNKRHRIAYLFLAPAVITFIVFTAVPIFMVAYLSFFKTNYITSEWIGLKNYIDMFKEEAFLKSIGNSLLYAAFLIPMGVGWPLVIALSSFNMKQKSQDFIRFIFYVPSLAAGIVMAGVWKWIFDWRKGLANYVLALFHIQPVMWFSNRMTAIGVISFMVATLWTGGNVLLLMAVMRSIPRSMIDTARVDGANTFQINRKIILPLISPWVLFIILIAIIGAFQIWELIYMLTSGGPDNSTTTMLYNIYETGFIYSKYGIASAKSLIMMLILLALALIKSKIEGKEERFL